MRLVERSCSHGLLNHLDLPGTSSVFQWSHRLSSGGRCLDLGVSTLDHRIIYWPQMREQELSSCSPDLAKDASYATNFIQGRQNYNVHGLRFLPPQCGIAEAHSYATLIIYTCCFFVFGCFGQERDHEQAYQLRLLMSSKWPSSPLDLPCANQILISKEFSP